MFVDMLTTALAADEVITKITFFRGWQS